MVDLFEGVPNEVIDKTLETIRGNLENVGLYGGHTVQRHADVQLLKLQTRLTMGDLKYATSYYDVKTAKKVVVKMMKAFYEKKIKNWLKNGGTDVLSLKCTFDKPIGYGYVKGSLNLEENLNKACLVLEKDPDMDWGFRIKTSYPLWRREG